MTHRLFGGDGVAEIVDSATPSKRVKELFQENFGDFGALATDVDAGLGIVDTDSLEVIVLDGGVAFGNGGIDILNATGGAELSDAGMAMQRLGGGVTMVASVVVLFLPLFIH